MPYLIVDPGSCHDGDLKKAKELVKIARESGADAVKFQLLTDKQIGNGNILLPWEWMEELINDDIEVFASVFSFDGVDCLKSLGIKSIKFPYSQQSLYCSGFDKVYRSSGVMDKQWSSAVNLFCIPEYPVLYNVNFDRLFPRFQGFSSHCMGIWQEIRANETGAKVIECHMKGTWDSPCPDAKFAKSPSEIESLVFHLRDHV